MMAASSLKQKVLEEHNSKEKNNLEVSMSEEKCNYLDVKQRIMIPPGFCPKSQTIELKITVPVIKINSKNSAAAIECGYEHTFEAMMKDQSDQSILISQKENAAPANDYLCKENEKCEIPNTPVTTSTIHITPPIASNKQYVGQGTVNNSNVSNIKICQNFLHRLSDSSTKGERLKGNFVDRTSVPISTGKVKSIIQTYTTLSEKMKGTKNSLVHLDTSVCTCPDSESDDKMLKEYFDSPIALGYVKSVIQEYNTLMKNISNGTIEKALRKSIEDFTSFILDHPDTSVKAKINRFETEVPEIKEDANRKETQVTGEIPQESIDAKEFKMIEHSNSSFEGRSLSLPSYKTFQHYLSEMNDTEAEDYSKIVEELVLQKFQNSLQKFVKRRNNYSLQEESSTESKNSENNSIDEQTPDLYRVVKYNYNAKLENDNCTAVECDGELSEFDERAFLDLEKKSQMEEISDMICINSGRNKANSYWRSSIGTSEISDMLSSVVVSDNSDVESTTDEKTNYILMEKLDKEANIISQVSKALQVCQNQSTERVEAERILLIASLRKQLLEEEIDKAGGENINETKIEYVRLSNIVIPVTRTSNKSSFIRFFVCVFQCGSTVLSSDLLLANKDMELKTNDRYYFEELPVNFEIIFQIYSMNVKITDKIKSSISSFKGHSQKLMKKVFPRNRRTSNKENNIPNKPSFRFNGECIINRGSIGREEFQILNPRIPIGNKFKCTVESSAV